MSDSHDILPASASPPYSRLGASDPNVSDQAMLLAPPACLQQLEHGLDSLDHSPCRIRRTRLTFPDAEAERDFALHLTMQTLGVSWKLNVVMALLLQQISVPVQPPESSGSSAVEFLLL